MLVITELKEFKSIAKIPLFFQGTKICVNEYKTIVGVVIAKEDKADFATIDLTFNYSLDCFQEKKHESQTCSQLKSLCLRDQNLCTFMKAKEQERNELFEIMNNTYLNNGLLDAKSCVNLVGMASQFEGQAQMLNFLIEKQIPFVHDDDDRCPTDYLQKNHDLPAVKLVFKKMTKGLVDIEKTLLMYGVKNKATWIQEHADD